MASTTKRRSRGPVAGLRDRYRKLRWWWRCLLLGAFAIGAAAFLFLLGVYLRYGSLAAKEDLANLGKMPQRSVVYDRNGEVIGRLHGSNRVIISIDDVSPLFIDALLAREDSRFFKHGGIDYLGVLRAMLRNFRDQRLVQGASTITMQLARNSYFGADKTLHRKILEIMMTRRIEKHFSKKEILTHYVNRIYFGAGLYGIERASEAYFHKHPRDLTLGEAALLSGIIRAPSRFSPVRHYDDALLQRDQVLERMLIEGLATSDEVAQARAEELKVHHVDPAFEQDDYALDAVRRDLDLFLEESEVEDGGFAIRTTLDLRVQSAVQSALEKHLVALEQTPGFKHPTRAAFQGSFQPGEPTATNYVQGAVVVLDNTDGSIVAIVGGRDFDHNKYNRALLARREIGSAFKPFVYATAFDGSLLPGTLIDDSEILPGELGEGAADWKPRNSDGTYRGFQPLEWGLIQSRNTMSVRVGNAVGLDNVMDRARRFGIASDPVRSPQLFIGNLGSTLKALTSAYSVFPNGGVLRRPFIIDRLEKIDGGVLRATPVVETPVVSPGTAWMTSQILQKVVDEGTAGRAHSLGLKVPAGGKTGTTNDYTDAWFLGYTSRLSAGVWVGLDNPATIIDRGYGSRLALPVWVDIMKAAEDFGYHGGSLEPPIPFTKVELCRLTGLLAAAHCRQENVAYVGEIPFEKVPRATCAYHGWHPVTRTVVPPPPAERFRRGVVRRLFDLFR